MIFITIALICLIAEAFFSSAEIAIVSANRAHMRQLAELGNRGAQAVEEFLFSPSKLLATTLLGTQLAVVTSTVVITLWLYRVVPENHRELFLLGGLTPILIIFGEIVPKAIVRQHADRMAPTMALILKVASKIFTPMVAVLVKVSGWGAKRLGVELHRKLVLREELEHLVDTLPDDKQIKSDVTEGERSMISRILDLSDVAVDQVMVPLSGISALPHDATMEEISREITEKKYSQIPIYQDRLDQLVGIVHASDVVKIGRSMQTAQDIMRTASFIPESSKVISVLQNLQKTNQSLAIVVDEYGGAVGIVTQEDILEEIVGDIEDEYDFSPPAIRPQKDGTYCIMGWASIELINKELELTLPESDEYETIAGFMLEKLKRIPRVGDEVKINDMTISVCAVTDRKIEEVRINAKKA